MKTFYSYLLIFSLSWHIAAAVELSDSSKFYFSYRAATYCGFIIPHAEAIAPVSGSNPYGFELSVVRLNARTSDLEKYRVYSNTHLFYNFIDFGNPSVLGYSHTVGLGFEPLIRPHRNFNGGIRFAAGLSYLTNVFDSISNPQNQFFSLPISGFLQITPSIYLRISDGMMVIAQASYGHISNGGIQKPNYGMNFPTFGIGIQYWPTPKTLHPIIVQNKPDFKKRQFSLDLYNSIKVLNDQRKTRAYILGMIYTAHFNLSPLHSLNVGLDAVYQGDIRHEQNVSDPYRVTVLGGYRISLGQVEFLLQLGTYIYSSFRAMDPVYQRYNLKYRFKNNFNIGCFVKAHRHVAEFMGISIGQYF